MHASYQCKYSTRPPLIADPERASAHRAQAQAQAQALSGTLQGQTHSLQWLHC